MKKLFITLLVAIIATSSFAQGNNTTTPIDDYQATQSSYERFMGATRNIVKFYSFPTPKIYCKGSQVVITNVRKIILQDDSAYYLRLSYTSYTTKRTYHASLTPEEVNDLLAAIELFINASKMDVKFEDIYILKIFIKMKIILS